jgi:NTP pyrophosphatase (non-canonical NTP hydrolase)
MKLTNEFQSIRDWATERGLYAKGDLKTQFIKLQEEVGELAKAILKEDETEMIDAIGDIVIVLTNLAALAPIYKGFYTTEQMTIEDCINSAFQVIVNRKGKMQNGTFVKEV